MAEEHAVRHRVPRPADVLRMYGGFLGTVEVLNTDAEGRLILADAIVRAAEDEPGYLIETSTLTGARIVALGARTAGVMGSEVFRDRVAVLGREVGEDAWTMPLPDHIRSELDSRVADTLANVTGGRNAGMLVAGSSCASSCRTGWHGRTSTSPGPRSTPAGPTATRPRAGRARTHAGGGAGGHRRTADQPRLARGGIGSLQAQVASARTVAQHPLPRVVVAHPLRVADDLYVVDRHPQRPGELLGGRGAADPTPGPLTVLRDQHDRGVGDRRLRLYEGLDALACRRPRPQVRFVVRARAAQRSRPAPAAQS